MAVKFEDIMNLDVNRKREIIKRTKDLKEKHSKKLFAKTKDLSSVLDKLYYLYTKDYSEFLNETEKLIFNIYTIYSDDDKFNKLIETYDKDFKKIASLYGVKEIYAKLRYLISKNLNKDTKVLKKIKD